jgi:hypothetical protein
MIAVFMYKYPVSSSEAAVARRDPANLVDQVNDLRSFLDFVEALIDDRVDEVEKQRVEPIDQFGRGPNGWENHSIESFLFAALRWAQDSDMGQNQGLPAAATWKAFAVFLYCGKIYE